MKLFNEYTIKALHFPTVLCIMPVIMCYISLYALNLINDINIYTNFITGSIIVLAYFASFITRDLGNKVQDKLFKNNDLPSKDYLKKEDNNYNPIKKKVVLEYLESLTIAKKSGVSDDESIILDTYMTRALSITRNKKDFNLLFIANVNYGFIRNLRGLRLPLLFFSLISLVAFINLSIIKNISFIYILSFITIILIYVLLLFYQSSNKKIKVYSVRYAKTLLDDIYNLSQGEIKNDKN